MNKKACPEELGRLVDNVAYLNESLALLQTVVSAIENLGPEHVLVTLDMAIDLLIRGRNGLVHAGVKALPVQATKEYYKNSSEV